MILDSSDWQEVTLGDICQFKYGKSLPAAERINGPFPVYGSNGRVGSHTSALTRGPTIIVGRKGSLGEVNYSETACWPIDTTYYIDRTATDADLRWLVHRLLGLELTQLNKAAAVPGLNRDDAYRKRLLLPPIDEQRRLANLLDHANSLRIQRSGTLTLLENFTQSVFVDMFVDGATPSWMVATVDELVDRNKGSIRTGPFGSQLLHSEFVNEGVAVLGIDNAVSNEFRWSERRYITEAKYKQLRRYTVYPGDVLITIMGTCGRAAVVPDDVPIAINTKHLCCITLDRSRCLPTYLHNYFLRHPVARSYLEKSAKGAIMSGLNMGIIRSLPVVLPPVAMQREFEARRVVIQGQREIHTAARGELDELIAALQQRAFAGRL